jgi:hypothetical protein
MLNACPAIVTTADRTLAVVLSVMARATVPLPLPALPD